MLLYRHVYEDELVIFKNGNIEMLGSYFEEDTKKNNFKYELNKKYVHFFSKIEDIPYALLNYRHRKNEVSYIVAISINDEIVRQYEGEGYYNSGYLNPEVIIKEYAIPSDLISKNCVVSIIKYENKTDKNWHIEDILNMTNDSFQYEKIETDDDIRTMNK